jgi:hypothetical protein
MRWVKQVAGAASAGRSRAQKRVTWSFDVETSTWASGWNVSAQTFESCAWENVARGFAVRVLRARRAMLVKLRRRTMMAQLRILEVCLLSERRDPSGGSRLRSH